MALWRCPHCGTLQPVAARCWVCRRSSTGCGTCRHFRASVAARIGYCGLDRDRLPLDGAEVRSCWVGRPLVLEDEAAAAAAPLVVIPSGQRYVSGFVPIDQVPARIPVGSIPEPDATPAPAPPPAPLVEPRDPSADGLFWAELEG